jgi:ubiquinone/menaquinone biosynthesis C-methylase UbiE
MLEECAVRAKGADNVTRVVGSVESIPFADESFDVVLALGVLEYVDAERALSEIRRVLRPDGRLLVSMLNPMSPYRFVEWHVYWPLLRLLGRVGRAQPCRSDLHARESGDDDRHGDHHR